MKPYRTRMPEHSIIGRSRRNDYQDAYGIHLPVGQPVLVEKLPVLFFESFPFWAKVLLIIRETIAGLVGLKTARRSQVEKEMKEFTGKVGESIALFHVKDRSENEIVTGENDKHLDFLLSFFVNKKDDFTEIILTTTVKFNGWMGKVYFLPVKPVHKILLPVMLKRMAKRLESRQ